MIDGSLNHGRHHTRRMLRRVRSCRYVLDIGAGLGSGSACRPRSVPHGVTSRNRGVPHVRPFRKERAYSGELLRHRADERPETNFYAG